jgi:hypothetical protein
MVAANFDILDGCTWLVQLQLQLLHLSMDSVVHLLHINGNQPNKFLILYNLNTTKPLKVKISNYRTGPHDSLSFTVNAKVIETKSAKQIM